MLRRRGAPVSSRLEHLWAQWNADSEASSMDITSHSPLDPSKPRPTNSRVDFLESFVMHCAPVAHPSSIGFVFVLIHSRAPSSFCFTGVTFCFPFLPSDFRIWPSSLIVFFGRFRLPSSSASRALYSSKTQTIRTGCHLAKSFCAFSPPLKAL